MRLIDAREIRLCYLCPLMDQVLQKTETTDYHLICRLILRREKLSMIIFRFDWLHKESMNKKLVCFVYFFVHVLYCVISSEIIDIIINHQQKKREDLKYSSSPGSRMC